MYKSQSNSSEGKAKTTGSRLRSGRRLPRRRGRRLRSAAAGSSTRMEDPIVVEDHSHDGDDSCIDLTSTVDDEFVDLTSSQRSHDSGELLGANDSSVVIIGTPDFSPPAHRRGRRNLPPADAFDDLPPPPFDIPSPIPSSSRPAVQSPEAIKITCPVCLDDDKMIKKDKRKLATTTCGHVFCQPCVEGSIRTQMCCPVCRKKLTLKNVFVLHI